MRTPILLLALCLAAPALAAAPGDKIPKFEARLEGGGKPRALDSHRTARPTVYLFVGAKCPTTGMYVERLRELEKAHAGKVDFVYIYPNRTDSKADKAAFHAAQKLAGPMIDDDGARIAQLLGAQRTAEAFVVDRTHRVVYHGAIDDDRGGRKVTRNHLALALDELLAGKEVSTPRTDVHA
jgi:peroxiredoxin